MVSKHKLTDRSAVVVIVVVVVVVVVVVAVVIVVLVVIVTRKLHIGVRTTVKKQSLLAY
jgi:hypothetical protein